MADVNGVTQDTANLHLDEVTGERISKSELKKRMKLREQEAKKAAKAAAAPPKQAPKKKESEEIDESNLNPNVSGHSTVGKRTPLTLSAILRDQKWSNKPTTRDQRAQSIPPQVSDQHPPPAIRRRLRPLLART